MKDKEILVKIFKLEKITVVLLSIILVFILAGLFMIYNEFKPDKTDNEYNTKYDVSMFNEISASDIESVTKDNLTVIYIGRSTCGWCAAFLPNLWDAQKEFGYTTQYIDIAKIIDFENGGISDQDSYDIMLSLTGDGYDDYMSEHFGSTPMILIMKDNKIIGAQTGYSEYDDFVKVLNDAGIE